MDISNYLIFNLMYSKAVKRDLNAYFSDRIK